MKRQALALGMGLVLSGLVVAIGERWQLRREGGSVQVVMDPWGMKYAISADEKDRARGWIQGREPTPRVTGLKRVVALGDSVTYGVQVGATQAWPEQLRDRLGQSLVEVFNFGVNGYDIEQVATLLLTEVDAWQPDLVIWGAYMNDYLPTYILYGTVSGDPVFVGTDVPEAAKLLPEAVALWLVRRSALFRRYQGALYTRAMEGKGAGSGRIDWYRDHLARIQAWAERNQGRLLVLSVAPHVLANPDACPDQAPDPNLCRGGLEQYLVVTRAIDESGLPRVDGLAAFQASGADNFFPGRARDPDHPSAEGHAVLAEALAPVARSMLWPGGMGPDPAANPKQARENPYRRKPPTRMK